MEKTESKNLGRFFSLKSVFTVKGTTLRDLYALIFCGSMAP
jgi:hypothetical protein